MRPRVRLCPPLEMQTFVEVRTDGALCTENRWVRALVKASYGYSCFRPFVHAPSQIFCQIDFFGPAILASSHASWSSSNSRRPLMRSTSAAGIIFVLKQNFQPLQMSHAVSPGSASALAPQASKECSDVQVQCNVQGNAAVVGDERLVIESWRERVEACPSRARQPVFGETVLS